MRVSPFRHPWINGYLPLPMAFRSLSRLSSAPGAKASALCPYQLNLSAFPQRLHSVAASRQSGSSFRALRASGFVVVSLFFLLVFRLSPLGFRRPRMSLSRRLVYLIDLIRVFLIPVFGFQGTIRVIWLTPVGLSGHCLRHLRAIPSSINPSGLKWTRTTDLTLIRRAL